jgi:PhoH-like ATPase
LTSAWGSGKTLIALSYALEKVHRGDYAKLVFVRNNIVVADTNDIGFLPGDMRDKMSIWGAPLADHLGGQEMLD